MNPISLMVIGESKAGKTHFGGQLLKRLQNRGSAQLQLDRMPESTELFKEVLTSLAQGNAAGHTVNELYDSVELPLLWGKDLKPFRLVWPDYGGEQIRQIVTRRRLTPKWIERASTSDGWLFFIRPSLCKQQTDIIDRPKSISRMKGRPAQTPKQEGTALQVPSWSDQARLVELLQILLYARRYAPGDRLRKPVLTILLSCWDEVAAEAKAKPPGDYLNHKMPLLASFLENNWYEDSWSVYGLSALGKSLLKDSRDRDFVLQGPEKQGWIVTPDGVRDVDLCLPIESMLRKVSP